MTGLKLYGFMRMPTTSCWRYIIIYNVNFPFLSLMPVDSCCSEHMCVFCERDDSRSLSLFTIKYFLFCVQISGLPTRSLSIQRLVEIKTIAEQLHFKISTLLLHSGKVIEAVTWFRQHVTLYSRLVGVPDTEFLHWEWMSRQFLVFAELLETSVATSLSIPAMGLGTGNKPLTEWEFYPAYYYQAWPSFIFLFILVVTFMQ